MLCCVMSLVFANSSFATDEPKRTLVGYSSELSARPGDTINFSATARLTPITAGAYEFWHTSIL
jgi:hypothetical protein